MNYPVLAFAWYKEEEFETFRENAQDKEKFSESYGKWERNARKSVKSYQREGARVEKVIIEYDEFSLWCRINRKENTAKSRSEYAARILEERFKY